MCVSLPFFDGFVTSFVATFFPVFIASKSAVYCPLLLKLLDLALHARMVKLVDTLDLGSSAFGVGVQVPLRAPCQPSNDIQQNPI